MMDIETRKRLTEKLLGERFMPGLVGFPYKHDGETISNRSFTTPADALDVMNRLAEKGKWGKFYCWASSKTVGMTSWEFDYWLFSPDETGVYRICTLAGEWLKEEGK